MPPSYYVSRSPYLLPGKAWSEILYGDSGEVDGDDDVPEGGRVVGHPQVGHDHGGEELEEGGGEEMR